MDITKKPAALTNPNAIEKALVSEILNHLAYLIMAESPNKSPVKAMAERYRGQLLSSLNTEEQKPFLASRNIIVELAKLLARAKSRDALGKTLAYIKSLNENDVMIIAEDTSESATRDRLRAHMAQKYDMYAFTEDELTQIIQIAQNLSHEA